MIVGAGSLRGGAAEPVLEHGRELAGEPPAPDEGSPIWTSIYLQRTTILKIFREGAYWRLLLSEKDLKVMMSR